MKMIWSEKDIRGGMVVTYKSSGSEKYFVPCIVVWFSGLPEHKWALADMSDGMIHHEGTAEELAKYLTESEYVLVPKAVFSSPCHGDISDFQNPFGLPTVTVEGKLSW